MTKTEKVAGLSSSKPALETQLAMIELQRMIKEFNPALQIEQSIQQLRLTPQVYGELIAEQIVPVIVPITQILEQLQDVLSDLRTEAESLKPAPIPAQKPTQKPAAQNPAQSPIPAPKPAQAPKDPIIQALPWLVLANLVISTLTLAAVFLRG